MDESDQRCDRWEEVDLGTISVPATVVGTQRWSGQIEASGSCRNDDLRRLPRSSSRSSDGYGKARATPQAAAGLVIARDSFAATTAGNALNARVAPLGGTWATSGDTTDWLFSDDFFLNSARTEPLKRVTTAAGTTGRFGIVGTTASTAVQVQAAILNTNASMGALRRRRIDLDMGVIARWTDASNYVRAHFVRTGPGASFRDITIQQVLAGVTTTLVSIPVTTLSGGSSDRWFIIRLVVSIDGQAIATLLDSTGNAILGSAQTATTVLATGGTLASGKSGIFDRTTSSGSMTRYYSDVAIFTAPPEPIVLYSGRNMQVRYDDVFRQDSTATYTGRPASYRGSRFLVPPGTSRVLVKARRNNIEVAADDNVLDATQIQVGWTPRGLAVPR
jgi:hypothetical protein